ncbi:hypothetical protein ACI2I3_10145 [Psychrobacter namhaensis]|uniref:Virion structural protein n=1 Tax=Psychrobacter namhaensis TaxID=292734 RepID=A0ABW8L9V8_9GAMM
MAEGFEVTDDFGRKQVLDSAPLLSFSHKITGATETNRIYISQQLPLALSPADGYVLLTRLRTADRYTGAEYYEDLPNNKIMYKTRTVGTGDVFVFGRDIPPAAADYGLEVFNLSGDLVFSSNQKPLKLLDVVSISDIRQTLTTINGRRTYWNKDYGGKQCAAIYIQGPIWGEDPYFMTAGFAKRGNTYAFEAAPEERDDAIFDYTTIVSAWGLQALIVDVTNY